MTPQDDLVGRLCDALPDFRLEWESDLLDDDFPSKTLHAVYLAFFPFAAASRLIDSEIEAIASIFNVEVAMGGQAENAVSTCVQEHLGRDEFSRASGDISAQLRAPKLAPGCMFASRGGNGTEFSANGCPSFPTSCVVFQD